MSNIRSLQWVSLVWVFVLLGLLNWGIQTQLRAKIPLTGQSLPFWESFDRPDLAQWQLVSGKYQLKNGQLHSLGDETLRLLSPFSVRFQATYALELNLEPQSEGRVRLLFNVQKSEGWPANYVQWRRQGKTWLISAGYLDEQKIEHQQGQTTLESSEPKRFKVLIEAKRFSLDLDNKVLLTTPLKYRGGLLMLEMQGGVSLDDFRGENWSGSVVPAIQTQLPDTANQRFVLYRASFSNSLDSSWRNLSGRWMVRKNSLQQDDAQGFDRLLILTARSFSQMRLRVRLQHLKGAGGGFIFNAPNSLQRNGAQLVRYSEDGKSVFWGYYNAQGRFVGQGFIPVEPVGTGPHLLEVVSRSETYEVLVDGISAAQNVPLFSRSGLIGLSTSQSQVAFTEVQVESEGTIFQTAPLLQPSAQQSVVLGRLEMTPRSGRWTQAGQAVRQENTQAQEFSLLSQDDFSFERLNLEVRFQGENSGAVLQWLAADNLEPQLSIRLSDNGSLVVWGNFEDGRFQSLGNRTLDADLKPRIIQLVRQNTGYSLLLDGNVLGQAAGPERGRLELLSLSGPTTFRLALEQP